MRDTRSLIERMSKEHAKDRVHLAYLKKTNQYMMRKMDDMCQKLNTEMRPTNVGFIYGKALRYTVRSWDVEESYEDVEDPKISKE